MALLRSLIGIIITSLIIAFALQNRARIDVHWSPVHPSHELPLYAIALGGLLIGFILGGTLVWINQAPLRKTKRSQKKEIKTLEKELRNVETANTNAQIPPSDFFPALPNKTHKP